MEYKNFKAALDAARNIDKFIDDAYKVGINMIDSKLYDSESDLLKVLFLETYGEEGLDWVQYYLWEVPYLVANGSNPTEMAKQDNENVDLSSDETLYEFLEKKYGRK